MGASNYKYTVYCLKNVKTGLKYIGQTTRSAKKRFQEHVNAANSGSSLLIHQAIREFGAESFEVDTLGEVSSREDLDRLELEMIETHNTISPNGYNAYTGRRDVDYDRSPVKLIGDLTNSSLKQLINLCRKNGVSKLKVSDIEITLDPDFSRQRMAPRGKSQATSRADSGAALEPIEPEEPEYTPEQVLFFSVPDAGLDGPQEVQ